MLKEKCVANRSTTMMMTMKMMASSLYGDDHDDDEAEGNADCELKMSQMIPFCVVCKRLY